jgi:hypothetical protein
MDDFTQPFKSSFISLSVEISFVIFKSLTSDTSIGCIKMLSFCATYKISKALVSEPSSNIISSASLQEEGKAKMLL